jgi:hypothetical protein
MLAKASISNFHYLDVLHESFNGFSIGSVKLHAQLSRANFAAGLFGVVVILA